MTSASIVGRPPDPSKAASEFCGPNKKALRHRTAPKGFHSQIVQYPPWELVGSGILPLLRAGVNVGGGKRHRVTYFIPALRASECARQHQNSKGKDSPFRRISQIANRERIHKATSFMSAAD
jgi:hypothetical protein